MGKKWMILICFFSILTFISSVITTIILFRIEHNRDEIKTTSLKATTKNYQKNSITYYGDNNISLVDLLPGAKIEKSFSIANINSDTLKYTIKWHNVVSNWNFENENFIYTLNCDDFEKIIKKMPTNPEEIITEQEIKSNSQNNCVLTIEVLDSEYIPGNEFSASYIISIEDGGATNEE